MKQPILSIVTICFENPSELEKTLNSIRSRYRKFMVEQIVVDGSRDNSCQAALVRHPWVDIVVHGHDEGRYDAMNKGVAQSSGRFLLFLNSGDFLNPESDFQNILSMLSKSDDETILYGDSIKRIGPHFFLARAPSQVSAKTFATRESPSHQAVFIPKAFFHTHSYDQNFPVSADTKLLIHAFEVLDSKHVGEIVSIFSLGGASNNWNSLSEVISHWGQRRLARKMTGSASALDLLKSVTKFLLIQVFGHTRYHVAYHTVLRRKYTRLKAYEI